MSRFEKIVQLEYEVPFISNRDVVLEAFGVHCVEEQALLIGLQSIDEHPFVELPPNDGKKVRGQMNVSGYYIEPVSDNETRVTMLMNFDPKLPVLPPWLMNVATGKILQWFFYYMEKAAEFDANSIYHERVQGDPEVYEHVKNTIAEL